MGGNPKHNNEWKQPWLRLWGSGPKIWGNVLPQEASCSLALSGLLNMYAIHLVIVKIYIWVHLYNYNIQPTNCNVQTGHAPDQVTGCTTKAPCQGIHLLSSPSRGRCKVHPCTLALYLSTFMSVFTALGGMTRFLDILLTYVQISGHTGIAMSRFLDICPKTGDGTTRFLVTLGSGSVNML